MRDDRGVSEHRAATATFLFTDIEGSTALLKQSRERYAVALADHHRILREAFAAHGGTVALRARMSIHTGRLNRGEKKYCAVPKRGSA